MSRSTIRQKGRSTLRLPAAGVVLLLASLVWLALHPGGSVMPIEKTASETEISEAIYHEVVRIVDGDTFIAMVDGSRERIRLIGIDAPEAAPTIEKGSLEATARLEEMLEGKSVILVRDVSERDPYDRLLRYVWLDAHTCVNLVLVEEGLATVMHIPPDDALLEDLRRAEQQARDAGRGLWASP